MNDTRTIVVHSGSFHCDDVFAALVLGRFLRKQHLDYIVVRSRTQDDIESADYVIDVGGVYDHSQGRYDHHQKEGAGERDNRIPYASFGLVWKHYGKELVSSDDVWNRVDSVLVQPIDAIDSGIALSEPVHDDVRTLDISSLIGMLNPVWNQGVSPDQTWGQAQSLAGLIFDRVLAVQEAAVEGEARTRQAYESASDKQIITIKNKYPWYVLSDYDEPLFVIKPRYEGSWTAEAVPTGDSRFERRIYYPLSWRGLNTEALQAESGVSDAIFVHRHGFTGAAQSIEGAVLMARKAIEHAA